MMFGVCILMIVFLNEISNLLNEISNLLNEISNLLR